MPHVERLLSSLCIHLPHATCDVYVFDVGDTDHEEVPLHVLLLMGHLTCVACVPCVIAMFNGHQLQNIWWPGGLSIVASALQGTHFGEG